MEKRFLVNKENLNEALKNQGVSQMLLASSLSDKINSSEQALKVRISAICRGAVIASEYSFLREIEKVLRLEKGSIAIREISKVELGQMKRKERAGKERIVKLLDKELESLESESIILDRQVVLEIRNFLQ